MNGGRRPNPGRGTANLNKTNDYQMTIRIINKNVKTTAPCHEYTNACRVNMAMHTRQAPGAHVSAACLDETAYCLVCMRVLYETHIHPSRGETAHAVHPPLSLPPPKPSHLPRLCLVPLKLLPRPHCGGTLAVAHQPKRCAEVDHQLRRVELAHDAVPRGLGG